MDSCLMALFPAVHSLGVGDSRRSSLIIHFSSCVYLELTGEVDGSMDE